MTFALLGLGLLAGLPASSPSSPAPDARQVYQERRAQAGRTPDDQVRLALWCEAHGLPAERLKHLALAVLTDPSHATARGLMGMVAYQGKWQRPDAVADKIKADADRAKLLAEYDDRRSKAAYTADAQWRMAEWCEEKGLADQARAHLTAVVRLDPSRELAWKRLGYVKHGNRWMTQAQIDADKAEAEAQKLADRRWKPSLEKWKGMLATPARKAEAEAAMVEVADPRAVPSIAKIFITARPADQAVAVRLLGQIDAPAASRALAGLAVRSADAEVRRAAVETLRRRDPREFVRLWIALIRDPIKYEVKPVGGPGSPGELFIEGKKANLRRVYTPADKPVIPNVAGARPGVDANGLPVVNIPIEAYESRLLVADLNQGARPDRVVEMFARAGLGAKEQAQVKAWAERQASGSRYAQFYTTPDGPQFLTDAPPDVQQALRVTGAATIQKNLQIPIGQMTIEAERSAASVQEQLNSDVAELDRNNSMVRRNNEPVLQALKAVTGQDLGGDQAAWNRWYTDQEGYAVLASSTGPLPTSIEQVSSSYVPTFEVQVVQSATPLQLHHSCFGAGTMVRTIDGSRAIETLSAGDRVLVQDTATGALDYQPIVAVFHNPPNSTFRISLGKETVVATGIHRFWKAGQGWTMARDLKEGDPIRTLGGVAAVTSVVEDRVQPVFNLEVAEGRSFFVGSAGALVHDNSLVEPTPNPFDAAARRAE